MKKKIMYLLLATMLCSTFTACGKEEKEPVKQEQTTDKEHDKNDKPEKDETEKVDEKEIGAEKETEKDENLPGKDEVKKDLRGEVKDGKFVNETFNISFDIKDNYTVLSDEELMKSVGVAVENIEKQDVYTSAQMEQIMNGAIYDFAVVFDDYVSNVIVCYENLDITNNGREIDAEGYMNAVGASVKRIYPEAEFSEYEKVEIWGDEYLMCNLQRSGVSGQIYLARIQDNYAVSLIVTLGPDSNVGFGFIESLEGFTFLEEDDVIDDTTDDVIGQPEVTEDGWTIGNYTISNDKFTVSLPLGYSYSQRYGDNFVIKNAAGDSIISFYLESGNYVGMEDAYYEAYVEKVGDVYPELVFTDSVLGKYNVKLAEGVVNNRNISVAIAVGEDYIFYVEGASTKANDLQTFFNGIIK